MDSIREKATQLGIDPGSSTNREDNLRTIANQLGLEAYGAGSDPRKYVGATYRELREILARDKDFIKCIFKPEPTYLGETIPVSSNGNATNDK